MAELSNEETENRTVKHTVLWKPGEWQRIEAAARHLAAEIHADVDAPDFIRGAVMRRADELLGPAAAQAA